MKPIIYIALVMVVLYVDGKRTEILPGHELPESVDPVDIQELLSSKSIEKAGAAEEEEKKAAKEGTLTQADFQGERDKLLARREANDAASASATDASPDPAAAAASMAAAAKTAKGKGSK